MRSEEEIEELYDDIDDLSASKYPGMTYEQGMRAALGWVLEEIENRSEIL